MKGYAVSANIETRAMDQFRVVRRDEQERIYDSMPEPDARLVVALREIQKRRGMSDKEFAHSLGITQPSWSRVRGGKRRPGLELARGAAKAYPELGPELVHLLGLPTHNWVPTKGNRGK
jgi:DNA-binding XRE family transcriptional regulator